MVTFFLEGLNEKDNIFCIFSRSRSNDEKEFKRGMLKYEDEDNGEEKEKIKFI